MAQTKRAQQQAKKKAEQIAKCVKLFNEGKDVLDIALALDCCEASVKNYLVEAGLLTPARYKKKKQPEKKERSQAEQAAVEKKRAKKPRYCENCGKFPPEYFFKREWLCSICLGKAGDHDPKYYDRQRTRIIEGRHSSSLSQCK